MHQAQVFAALPPAPLSRTSSAASFSSEDDACMSSSTAATVISSSRRTRKRFTNVQLTMLENLFHQNSHPSREDREAVAKAGGMEIKSVTIWFQNKRQTERKTAASNNGPAGTHPNANVVPNITSTLHTFSLHSGSQASSRTASPPYSTTSSSTHTTSSSRPSLDRVASRTELRVSSAPRTPSRRSITGAIWDSMPSSPLAPPISPPARDFIDFGKNARTRRTLEWACAAARMADKDGYASGLTTGFGGERGRSAAAASFSVSSTVTTVVSTKHSSSSSNSKSRSLRRENSRSSHSQVRVHHHKKRESPGSGSQSSSASGRSSSERERRMSIDRDGDATEEEDHEAITPPSTWGKDDARWNAGNDGSYTYSSSFPSASAASGYSSYAASASGPLPKGVDDDDMFKAALALCGLGRR
ncbi:hypothetical protein CVT26_000695 [Gymnopilus dilepis]|uniref:Homeobox domain-containing protein n=1 Tax=Gymnopilus dilepis TaxID=231916 RepID=A0A409W783_9AGAR|nr:hypothetical protein CVT26_000695 [Gymnopilus dilepis]